MINTTFYNESVAFIYSSNCWSLYRFYDIYVEKALGATGLAINMACIAVFIKLLNHSDTSSAEMNKYLLFKSIVDAYCMLKLLVFAIFDCRNCDQYRFYSTGIFKLVFLIYLSYVAQLLSMCCELAANYIRYKAISTESCLITKKLSFRVAVSLMILYSMLFYSYKLIERKIVARRQTSKNASLTIYRLTLTEFGTSDTILKIEFVHSLVRDGLIIALIFVLNILTLTKMRRLLREKEHILEINGHTSNKRVSLRTQKANINLTLMVFVTGSIAIVGHGFYFAFHIPSLSWHLSECAYPFVNFGYTLSYVVNFFVYYFFNKNFRKCFLDFCLRAKLRRADVNIL